MLMNTVVNSLETHWLEAVAETIDETFIYLKEQIINGLRFIHTYRLEMTLTALATFFVLFSIYVISYTTDAGLREWIQQR